MPIDGLDHVYVECRDFERTLAFWKALGFALVAEWGEDGHRAGRLTSGQAALVLAEAKAPVGPTMHLATRDPEALNARLAKDPAVEVETPLEDTHWGTRWIRVRDPEGNVWALESPQTP